MCKLMDDLIKDVVKDEVSDYRLETAKKLIALGDSSLDNIAKVLDLPLSTIEELASQIPKEA